MAFSRKIYTGDGTTSYFVIPFDYLSPDHISAYVDSDRVEIEDIQGGVVYLTQPPESGSKITILRETPQDEREVNFVSSPTLSKEDLDTSARQLFFLFQENYDKLSDYINLLEDPDTPVDPLLEAQYIRDKLKTVDGEGSGIDADKLDGKQGNEYALATHTHAESTPEALLTALKTVDGEGSGLDAEFINGQDIEGVVRQVQVSTPLRPDNGTWIKVSPTYLSRRSQYINPSMGSAYWAYFITASLTLPEGGTWAWLKLTNTPTQGLADISCGVSSGGTVMVNSIESSVSSTAYTNCDASGIDFSTDIIAWKVNDE